MRNGIFQDGGGKSGGDLSGFQGAADFRRGDGDLDIVDVIELDAGRGLVDVAGTADHQETNAAHYVAPAVPGADLGEGVSADEEVQLVSGSETRAYFLYGIDGVTARRVFLEAGNFEARVALAGEFGHADTIGVGRVGDAGLVRWMGSGDKEDAVEAVAFGGLAREGEVAVVDGIEGAAEDRQFQGVHRVLWGRQSCLQPAFSRLDTLESVSAAWI